MPQGKKHLWANKHYTLINQTGNSDILTLIIYLKMNRKLKKIFRNYSNQLKVNLNILLNMINQS